MIGIEMNQGRRPNIWLHSHLPAVNRDRLVYRNSKKLFFVSH
jgi:hypothetical protein